MDANKKPLTLQQGVIQQQTYKPGSVLPCYGQLLSFIWPCHHWQIQATYPSRISAALGQRTGASNSASGTYLVFQLLRFTAIPVARKSRELLPHVFTLAR